MFHHVSDHLLGHVKHRGQVGGDDRIPVFQRHFQKHAVTRNARVVDQHRDGAVVGFGFRKRINRALPFGNVAHRSVEREAESLLLVQPLLEVTRRAATGNNGEAVLMQTLAHGRSNATHTAGDVRYFICHDLSC